jgi:hypothetical protein
MAHVMQGIPGVSVYIDDITALSRSWEEHLATRAFILGFSPFKQGFKVPKLRILICPKVIPGS